MKKNLRNLALAFVCFISAQAAFAFNDRPISPDQLPQAAQQVLSKHFSGIKIKIAKYESLERSYDVVLENGVTLEFNKQGAWTEIDGRHTAIPAELVPSQIRDYVNAHHAGAQVLKIEKVHSFYEVDLTGDVDLTFNKRFKVIDIDY